MSRYFTYYWQNDAWSFYQQMGEEGKLLDHCAGNRFHQRRVSPSDEIYVVTVKSGKLFLCGKMVVRTICNAIEAAKYLKCQPKDLWGASDHVIASRATPKNFSLIVPIDITNQLRFISSGKIQLLKFSAPNELDRQTLRGVRELHHTSAAELSNLLPSLQPALNL